MFKLHRLWAASLLALIGSAAYADTYTPTHTFTAGTSIQSSQVNANFTGVGTVINGNLDNANIKSAAAIAWSKMAVTTELPILRAAGVNSVSVGVTGDTAYRASLGTTAGGKGGIFFGAGSATAQDICILRKNSTTLQIRNAADGSDLNLEVGTITASGGTSGPTYTVSNQTAHFTASGATGTYYRIDTTGGAVTCTLDSSVSVGAVYKIERSAGSNAVTISANGGQTIDNCGSTGSITLSNSGIIEITRVSGGWDVT